jgi:hypothetical protein
MKILVIQKQVTATRLIKIKFLVALQTGRRYAAD